jgi:DNA replication protein DnaC
MDPPGFALESFDVMGARRDRYRAVAEDVKPVSGYGLNGQAYAFHYGLPVDAAGELPDGRAFSEIKEFKRLILSDEVARRDSLGVTLRVQKARLDPTMVLEAWDSTAKVTLDRTLLNELASLRFLDTHAHIAIVGPVGVGKTFLAHALGHIACRRGASVLAVRTDAMLKTLKHARLDHTYDAELRKLIAVDLLILDDFAIDVLDPTESRDLYDLLLERYRTGSIVVTSNRGPDEWLATFADPLRAQSAIDRFTSNAYDLVIDGESYRPRLKPTMPRETKDRGR